MKLYKLTDEKGQTQNKTQWGENVTHSIPPEKQSKKLCTAGLLHAYKDINLALLLNPIYGRFFSFQLWEAKGKPIKKDWGKIGCHKLTTIKQIKIPKWYQDIKTRRRVQILFAILCAEAVLIYCEKFDSKDKRPHKAIEAAKDYLNNNAAADAAYAAADAAYAAYAAAYAAYAAAYAADAAINFIKLAKMAVQKIIAGEKT